MNTGTMFDVPDALPSDASPTQRLQALNAYAACLARLLGDVDAEHRALSYAEAIMEGRTVAAPTMTDEAYREQVDRIRRAAAAQLERHPAARYLLECGHRVVVFGPNGPTTGRAWCEACDGSREVVA